MTREHRATMIGFTLGVAFPLVGTASQASPTRRDRTDRPAEGGLTLRALWPSPSLLRMLCALCVLAVCPVLSGCTFIGLAIGVSCPTYKEVPSLSAVPLQERVRLTARTPEPAAPVEPVAFGPPAPDATPHATEDITGSFRGIEDGWVRLDTPWTYGRKIRADRVERVRVIDGNYWAVGLGIGFLADFATVAALAGIASAHGGFYAGK